MEPEIVGFRFKPTSHELVNHHLKRKLMEIDETRCVIPNVYIYDYNPTELRTVYNENSCKKSTSWDSYFFCRRNRVNATSDRSNRKAKGGYWKPTGKKHDIQDEETGKTIGTKTVLSFYGGCQGDGQETTEWAMHEYHLNSEDAADNNIKDPTAFSICHVKRKTRKTRSKNIISSKKRQSKKQKTNTEAKECQKAPTQPSKGSACDSLVSADQSSNVNNGFYDGRSYPDGIMPEQGDSVMQNGLRGLGGNETTPQTGSSISGWPDYYDYENGISLSDLWTEQPSMNDLFSPPHRM